MRSPSEISHCRDTESSVTDRILLQYHLSSRSFTSGSRSLLTSLRGIALPNYPFSQPAPFLKLSEWSADRRTLRRCLDDLAAECVYHAIEHVSPDLFVHKPPKDVEGGRCAGSARCPGGPLETRASHYRRQISIFVFLDCSAVPLPPLPLPL